MTSALNFIDQDTALTQEQAHALFEEMMRGRINDADMRTVLTRLAERGETADEIIGAARALRQHAVSLKAPAGTIDCCGTGGDGLHTLNISSAVALVVAACGVPVAKHGNRAASSKSGAADVLETLGANLDAPPEKLEAALRETNFCFLMAPRHHPAMKHVAAVRKSLGRRTIFNLLGPLANPAGVTRQLVGVPERKWVFPMAQALQALGSSDAWVVHGANGMDEISLSGETYVAQLKDGDIKETILTPDDFGLTTIALEDIRGGDAQVNAAALTDLLAGKSGPYRDIVIANAAAALVMAGKAGSLTAGVDMAQLVLNNSSAANVLSCYSEMVS